MGRGGGGGGGGILILVRILYAQCIYLLRCKFQTITLETVGEVAETITLLCHVYMAIFLSKSSVWFSIIKNLISVLW